jgi:hypothetical protein
MAKPTTPDADSRNKGSRQNVSEHRPAVNCCHRFLLRFANFDIEATSPSAVHSELGRQPYSRSHHFFSRSIGC